MRGRILLKLQKRTQLKLASTQVYILQPLKPYTLPIYKCSDITSTEDYSWLVLQPLTTLTIHHILCHISQISSHFISSLKSNDV